VDASMVSDFEEVSFNRGGRGREDGGATHLTLGLGKGLFRKNKKSVIAPRRGVGER